MSRPQDAIAALAAQLVVDEGLDYGPAKHKAARRLGLEGRGLPDNDAVEAAVREELALFHADTQPAELRALRELALRWMERLAEFRPHLVGAAWRGTATRRSDLHLALYCDDPKSCEIALINQGLDFEVASQPGRRGEALEVLGLMLPCPALGERVRLRLHLHDTDDLRGALRPDAQGLSDCGDARALRRRLDDEERP